jgi:hypothetical protein
MYRAALLALLVAPLPAYGVDMALAKGAELRVLDKLTGDLAEVNLSVGQSQTYGKLTVQLNECRYPADNKTAEAEVHLTIIDSAVATPVFTGWMIASSPALSALDHARYDVWALRCDVPDFDLPAVAAVAEDADQGADAATEDGAAQ